MNYFPNNTTSHFQTKLPHEWRLVGDWAVGLSEIQFPQTFSHISSDNYIKLITTKSDSTARDDTQTVEGYLKSGIYQDLNSLLYEINVLISDHIKMGLDVGGHVVMKRICEGEECDKTDHVIMLHPKLWSILGFSYRSKRNYRKIEKSELRSNSPASLSNALPSMLFVYTDLCESHVTGDVQTPLLRVVPVDVDKYQYGSMRLRTFSNPKYIKLLKTNFETIEINIRSETGKLIPFDHGTLSVTLHFKRID